MNNIQKTYLQAHCFKHNLCIEVLERALETYNNSLKDFVDSGVQTSNNTIQCTFFTEELPEAFYHLFLKVVRDFYRIPVTFYTTLSSVVFLTEINTVDL